MKLLIITQRVDKDDEVLGFFHGWLNEFSKYGDTVTVICLEKHTFDLGENIKVLSLGKESRQSRIKYILNFYQYIWQERNNYDTVFVHMNEEYVLLGWFVWKILGKKVSLWRNHLQGSIRTRLAVAFSDRVFCTSPQSFTALFAKTKIMPVGIHTDLYVKNLHERNEKTILFFGRISRVKNVHIFIEALHILSRKKYPFRADIIGSPVNPEDFEYEQYLHELAKPLVASGAVHFSSGRPFSETGSMYSNYSLYVNLTPSGSLDKVILEAMASATPVLVRNSAFKGILDSFAELGTLNPDEISEHIEMCLNVPNEEKIRTGNRLSEFVREKHSLAKLVVLLREEFVMLSRQV